MTIFLGKENIEIEFHSEIVLRYNNIPFKANKIGIEDVNFIIGDSILSVVTNDFDRLVIAPLECIKSITEVDNLTVNQFGYPIERED